MALIQHKNVMHQGHLFFFLQFLFCFLIGITTGILN